MYQALKCTRTQAPPLATYRTYTQHLNLPALRPNPYTLSLNP